MKDIVIITRGTTKRTSRQQLMIAFFFRLLHLNFCLSDILFCCVPHTSNKIHFAMSLLCARIDCCFEIDVIDLFTSVCAGQPVGTSDIFIIPDHRFSASSSRIANEPSKARLDGDSAWVPSTNNNNDDYLEIDLGSVYFVCGVATQGNSGSSEWTTLYKIKTSLNNRNWTVYMEHGTEKVNQMCFCVAL